MPRLLSSIVIILFLFPLPLAAKYVFHLKDPQITASSRFAEDVRPWRYPAINVFDGSAATVWCEGARDHNGTGEYIDLITKHHIRIDGIRIKNGFSRDPVVASKNTQVKQLDILSINRKSGLLRKRTSVAVSKVTFNSKKQAEFAVYKLPKNLIGRRFRFVIADVYPNPKDTTRDVCLGELQIGTYKGQAIKWLELKDATWMKAERKRLARLQKKAEFTLPLVKNKKLPYGKSIAGVVRSLANGEWSTEPVSEMDPDTYYLCADGTARRAQTSAIDGFSDLYGTWKFDAGRVFIRWKQEVQHIGVGDPTDSVRNLLFDNFRTSRRQIHRLEELKWQPDWPKISSYKGNCRFRPAKKLQLNQVRQSKAKWKQIDKDGYTLLMWAVAGQNTEVVRFLAGRSPLNHVNKWSDSALSLAVDGGNPEIVRILLKAGADPKKYKTRTPIGPGETQYSTFRIPVVMAVRQLKPKILRALLQTGYPLNRKYKHDYQKGKQFTLKSLLAGMKPGPGDKDRFKRIRMVLDSFSGK